MASWQARMMNLSMRIVVKPMASFANMRQVETMTKAFQEKEPIRIPEGCTFRRVQRDNYEGDWIQATGKRPRKVLLFFPGGGFIIRSGFGHRDFVASVCKRAGVKALIIHYRLAPADPFPGGLEDCLAAYHDLLDQGIDPADISLGGDSAGGGLVLSTLMALRDEGTPLPKNAFLLSPLGDLTHAGASRKFNARRDPMLPHSRKSNAHQFYIGEALAKDRYLSPVLADFDGFPPMLGLVGSTEILLSDTLSAADQARKADIPFFLEIWDDMPHVFPVFKVLPESKVAIERIAQFITSSELGELPAKLGSSTYSPPEKTCRLRMPGAV